MRFPTSLFRVAPAGVVACLIQLSLAAGPALGRETPPQPEQKPAAVPDAAAEPVVVEHEIVIDGQILSYRSETGMLPLLADDGSTKASVFFVAYTLAGGGSERPILFCFNGGPGASAVWLHLGGLGPKRALVNPDGTLPPPPYRIVDNEHSLLPAADLVFIDPVATGYSRPAKDEKPEQFFGQDADIDAMADFIRLYTSRHGRWGSPKYLCGESYGVFRAAGLAERLQDRHGMFLNGLVLVSGLVDFGTIRPGESNDLPHSIFLPSLTATAHFHRKLPADLQADRKAAIAEARSFAGGDYLQALFAGSALPEQRRQATAEKLSRLTGLPVSLVLEHDLRIDAGVFRKELLAGQGLILGRFDGRITGRDGSPAATTPRFDPSYTAALGPLASTMNDYVRGELGFESDLPYRVLTGVGPWKYDQNTYASTADDLARAMSKNPHLRVLVLTGRCDLAVPADSMRYSVDHLDVAAEVRANVSYADYDSGHMMYLNLPDLEKLEADVAAFLEAGGT